jgi:hypothetical protein
LTRGAQPVALHGITTYYGGHLHLFVAASDRPQILHLTSNDAAIWHVHVMPGARLSAIYLSGFEPQGVSVQGSTEEPGFIPPRIVNLGTNLVAHPTLAWGPPLSFAGRPAEISHPLGEPGDYRAEVERVTGHRLTDFQGLEQFRRDQAIAVPAGHPFPPEVIQRHFRLALYPGEDRPATAEFEQAKADIAALVASGKLPAHIPLYSNDTRLSEAAAGSWDVMPKGDRLSAVVASDELCGPSELGTAADDALYCSGHASDERQARTKWVVGGAGDDIISDGRWKSQVMSGGPGDDIIVADLGNDVLHFATGWGHDQVAIRCGLIEESFYRPDPPADEPRYMHSRYIVFGAGIRGADLRWRTPNQLVDARTGDSITFTGGVGAFLLAVDGQVPPRPRQPGDDGPVPPEATAFLKAHPATESGGAAQPAPAAGRPPFPILTTDPPDAGHWPADRPR